MAGEASYAHCLPRVRRIRAALADDAAEALGMLNSPHTVTALLLLAQKKSAVALSWLVEHPDAVRQVAAELAKQKDPVAKAALAGLPLVASAQPSAEAAPSKAKAAKKPSAALPAGQLHHHVALRVQFMDSPPQHATVLEQDDVCRGFCLGGSRAEQATQAERRDEAQVVEPHEAS